MTDTTTATGELEQYKAWVGRTRTTEDIAAPFPPRALAATLDSGDGEFKIGDALPPLWHWLYFLEAAPASQIGPDGHPRRGDFLPPVTLPRRMWAGSRLKFPGVINVGDKIHRRSEILAVEPKSGGTGQMVFVTVLHRVSANGVLATVEEHDIVFRQAAQPGDKAPPPKQAPTDSQWRKDVVPDPVLLFRFSALTFNGHRIHYDLPYVTGEEGYPGLIVHGPLMGLMMLELARRANPDRRIAAYQFRAINPVFHTTPFAVCAKAQDGEVTTWIARNDGALAQQGKVTLA
jgi:3-methylfumaryl-CoA hydratase